MKLTWRIWVLVFVLALMSISILNLPVLNSALIGLLIISIPVFLVYTNSKKVLTGLIVLVATLIILITFFSFQKGVIINSVDSNSPAFSEGLRKGMTISEINGIKVENLEDFIEGESHSVESNGKNKYDLQTPNQRFIFVTNDSLGISVTNIPKTNLKTGLDLSGGARAIVRPVDLKLDAKGMADLVAVTSNRLNVFGISDVNVRTISDLEGNNFLLVEVAGITTEDLRELVGQQGKFEAKVGNKTAFIGGERDITSVCRNDATCAGVESCQPNSAGGYYCNFRFSVYLSEAAAERHAEITKNLSLDPSNPQYLSEKLNLVLDDKEVDSLYIGADLKGRATTQIQISGSGSGATKEDAYNDAKNSMNKLQTILITGSLPYKLEIVKLDSASPVLGKEFTKNLLYLGLVVFIVVCVLLFIKYKKLKITSAVILTMFSEALITLGIAALIKWNLDAPSIAGIIAGMGVGVNDQIVIIDESVSNDSSSLKDKIKRALFIIVGAFFTIFAAMLPLFWAGAGLLRGFALTTLISVTIGILITRPAFADIMKKIQE